MSFQLKFNKKKGKKAKSKSSYRKPPANVFGDDDENDDNEGADNNNNDNNNNTANNQSSDRRSTVNRAIAQEQEAMRKRAEQSMKQAAATAGSSDIYDYDGSYDSFHQKDPPNQHGNDKSRTNKEPQKGSRYMTQLLQAAQERNYGRDVAYERKLKRDLEREEAENPELLAQSSERFVTSAYKKKLEERKLWQEQQDEHDKKNSNSSAGAGGMANFYGNLHHNVAMGGGTKKKDNGDTKEQPNHDDAAKPSFLDGFEQPSGEPQDATAAAPKNENGNDHNSQPAPAKPLTREETLVLRDEKLARARERYFERRPDQRPNE